MTALDDILLRSAIKQAHDAQKGISSQGKCYRPREIEMFRKNGLLFHDLGLGTVEFCGFTDTAAKIFLDDNGDIREFYKLPCLPPKD